MTAFLSRIGAFAQRIGVPDSGAERRPRANDERMSKLIAERCIDEALALDFDEPNLVRHWRARQLGRAFVRLKSGAYREATTAALRARLPAALIPENELSREIAGALDELSARRKLMRRN